jgi:DNA replication protein DnaC
MAGRKRLPDIMGEALGWLENEKPIIKGKSPLGEIEPAPKAEPLPGAKILAMHPPLTEPDPKLMDKLESLKLKGMSRALKELSGSPLTPTMGFEELLFVLLDAEETERDHRSLLSRLGKARLHYDQVRIEDIDLERYPAPNRKSLSNLADCGWLESGQDLVIRGGLGSGKTYLACAMVRQACELGFNAYYRRLGSVMRELAEARKDERRFARMRRGYVRADLLVLDDWGLERLPSWQSLDLFELLEERHGRKSTLVASSLPQDSWSDILDEAPLPGTIIAELLANAVDRLANGAIGLELDQSSQSKAMGD